MPRKNSLLPVHLVSAQATSASFQSSAVNISFLDNVAVQINAVTNDAVGTFQIQGSLDHVEQNSVVQVAGNWIPITLPATPTLASANQQILLDLNQLSFPYIRVAYVRSSGSNGTIDIYISSKEV